MKNNQPVKRYAQLIVSLVVALGVDQLIKYILTETSFGGSLFRYLRSAVFLNEGAVFSITVPFSAHLILAIVTLIFFGWLFAHDMKSDTSRSFAIATGILFGGALSNLIDRIRLNAVVDYLPLPFGGVINLADMYIGIAILFIIFRILPSRETIEKKT